MAGAIRIRTTAASSALVETIFMSAFRLISVVFISVSSLPLTNEREEEKRAQKFSEIFADLRRVLGIKTGLRSTLTLQSSVPHWHQAAAVPEPGPEIVLVDERTRQLVAISRAR